MKRDITFLLFPMSFLLLFSGCGRIIDWGKGNVDQGEDIKEEVVVGKDHIRSARIYDQFTLVGAFDSLWLSDEVREIYSDIYVLKRGRSEEEKNLFLRRQLEENNHFISFYVLSVAEVVIGEKDSGWTVFLNIGDYNFVPTELKTVELSPEYKQIFGEKLSRFKTAYIVRFHAKDIEDVSLVQPGVDAINLVFRTVEKEAKHVWKINDNGRMVRT